MNVGSGETVLFLLDLHIVARVLEHPKVVAYELGSHRLVATLVSFWLSNGAAAVQQLYPNEKDELLDLFQYDFWSGSRSEAGLVDDLC